MTIIVRLTERDLTRIVKRVINDQAWGEFDDITPAFQVFCNSLNSKIPQPSQKPNTTSATQPKLSVKRVVNRQVAPGQPQGDGFMWQFYLGGKPPARDDQIEATPSINVNNKKETIERIVGAIR